MKKIDSNTTNAKRVNIEMFSRKKTAENTSTPTFNLSESFNVGKLNKGLDDRFEYLFNDMVQETLNFYADNMKMEQVIQGQKFVMPEDAYRQRIHNFLRDRHKNTKKKNEVPHRQFMVRVHHTADKEMDRCGFHVTHVPEKYIEVTCAGEEDDSHPDSVGLEEDSYLPPPPVVENTSSSVAESDQTDGDLSAYQLKKTGFDLKK